MGAVERERKRMPGQSEGDDCHFLVFYIDANTHCKQVHKSQREVRIARCRSCFIAFAVSLFLWCDSNVQSIEFIKIHISV